MASLIEKMGVQISGELKDGFNSFFSKKTLTDVMGRAVDAGRDGLKRRARELLAETPEGQSTGRAIVKDQALALVQSPWLWGGLILLAVFYVVGRRA